jgi:hypothetical protein
VSGLHRKRYINEPIKKIGANNNNGMARNVMMEGENALTSRKPPTVPKTQKKGMVGGIRIIARFILRHKSA